MKKIIFLLIALFLPITIFAYSDHIILGGDTLGIEINSKGVIVVGKYKVNNTYLNPNINVGDIIIKVNNVEVNTTNELVEKIEKYMKNNTVDITYLRNNEEINTTLNLLLYKNNYRTGLYVKGNILGIGTLSYVDPETGIYGVLGHSLNISNTKEQIKIKDGYSYEANVTSFTKSTDGKPGSKNAEINKDKLFGSIISNSNYGIFGKVESSLRTDDLIEVGSLSDIKLGSASIATTNLENKTAMYAIKIIEVDESATEKNIYFEITDEELLKMSGGIVQGMSGSPIIQDNKIIGAVTRVLVDEVNRGYGISIVTMLKEGDKLLN